MGGESGLRRRRIAVVEKSRCARLKRGNRTTKPVKRAWLKSSDPFTTAERWIPRLIPFQEEGHLHFCER